MHPPDPATTSSVVALAITFKKEIAPLVQRAIDLLLKAINIKFGYKIDEWHEEKKETFKKNFEKYAKKISSISEEDLISPPNELAVPILEKFTYVSSEELSNMFAELLTQASSKKTVGRAHPSFLKIIEALSNDEALILKGFKDKKIPYQVPCADIRLQTNGINGWKELFTTVTSIEKKIDLKFPAELPTYLSNLIDVLGLIEKQKNIHITQENVYQELEELDLYKNIKSQVEAVSQGKQKVTLHKYHLEVSALGKSFIATCIPE